MTIFRYKEELISGGEKKVIRPVAEVYIKSSNNSWIKFHPYIDSGADITMVPLTFGKLLGFKLDEEKVEEIGGIRGSVPVIYIKSKLRIGTKEFLAKVAWSLIENVPPLLGRADVFDRFSITFKQREKIVLFEPVK